MNELPCYRAKIHVMHNRYISIVGAESESERMHVRYIFVICRCREWELEIACNRYISVLGAESESERMHVTVTFLLSVPRVRVRDCLQPYISVVGARVRVGNCVQPLYFCCRCQSESERMHTTITFLLLVPIMRVRKCMQLLYFLCQCQEWEFFFFWRVTMG